MILEVKNKIKSCILSAIKLASFQPCFDNTDTFSPLTSIGIHQLCLCLLNKLVSRLRVGSDLAQMCVTAGRSLLSRGHKLDLMKTHRVET